MSSSAYKCGATAGQTAAGQITGANYWALIGFWQPEGPDRSERGPVVRWSSGQDTAVPSIPESLRGPSHSSLLAGGRRTSVAASLRPSGLSGSLLGRKPSAVSRGRSHLERHRRPGQGAGPGRLSLPFRGGRHPNDTETHPRALGRRTECGGRRGPAPAPLHGSIDPVGPRAIISGWLSREAREALSTGGNHVHSNRPCRPSLRRAGGA